MENLDNIIEAILFALGREITVEELKEILIIDDKEIIVSLNNIKNKYNDENNGIKFSNVNNKYTLVTNSKYYDYIKLFVENTKRKNLSVSVIEVLTIIAYNSKITKTEIEKIRGVNSDFAVSRLLECGLIYEVTRLNLPGRPAAYSVTDEFLRNCDISSLEELPDFNNIKISDEQMLFNDINNESDINDNEIVREEKEEVSEEI